MKNKIFKIASLAAVFAFIMGCDNSAIDGVKNGTLKGYEQTTVGKAFESVLGNPQWTYFETNKGVRVVQLSGSPSSQIVPTFLYRRLCVNQSKYNMKIQFTLHTTDDGFDIAYCGLGEDKSMDCGDFIQYAYGGNSSYEPVDCSIFGTLTDARDGHTYGSVKIGNQVWMSENLNYKVDDSWCCHDDERECEKYGRLYTWAAAMDACPMGWHLPTQKEFETLIYAVGGSRSAGTKLKSQSGWKKYQSGWMINSNGTDDYFFSALAAGYRNGNGFFVAVGSDAYFWSATEEFYGNAYSMWLGDGIVDRKLKTHALSVRCIKD